MTPFDHLCAALSAIPGSTRRGRDLARAIGWRGESPAGSLRICTRRPGSTCAFRVPFSHASIPTRVRIFAPAPRNGWNGSFAANAMSTTCSFLREKRRRRSGHEASETLLQSGYPARTRRTVQAGTWPSTVQRRTTRRCVDGSYGVARCIRQRLSHTINCPGCQRCS